MTRGVPLHQRTSVDTFWTTANATEAIPGITTPLTWSFYDDATELAIRGAFAEMGTLRRGEVVAPSDPDQRFIGIAAAQPQLAETVIAFADAGLSLANAADALGIHPNTVAYRLGQWHKLTGSDPRTFSGLARSIVGIAP